MIGHNHFSWLWVLTRNTCFPFKLHVEEKTCHGYRYVFSGLILFWTIVDCLVSTYSQVLGWSYVVSLHIQRCVKKSWQGFSKRRNGKERIMIVLYLFLTCTRPPDSNRNRYNHSVGNHQNQWVQSTGVSCIRECIYWHDCFPSRTEQVSFLSYFTDSWGYTSTWLSHRPRIVISSSWSTTYLSQGYHGYMVYILIVYKCVFICTDLVIVKGDVQAALERSRNNRGSRRATRRIRRLNDTRQQ
jgi:hypothetical protein